MGRTCGEPDEIELTRHGGEIERLRDILREREAAVLVMWVCPASRGVHKYAS